MDENVKKLPKRNIVLYVSIAVLMISLTFKASYAYFVSTITNANTPTPTVVDTGDLQIKFDNGATYINAQNIGLMSAEEAMLESNNYSRFTVTNSGSVNGKYKLYLSDYSISSNLVDDDFKWKLTVNGTSYTGTFNDLFGSMTPNSNNIIASNSVDVPIVSNVFSLASGGSHSCEFRIWLQETDENQISLTEGTFSGTIKLIATNE